MNQVKIYTDGGSRGNPGPGGLGAVIIVDKKRTEFQNYLGDKVTNNEAEYEALIMGLKKTRELLGKKGAKEAKLECFTDSELMVKQFNHQYKLKNPGIQKRFIIIWNLMLDFRQVNFTHIPREKNKEADRLANQAMDQQRGTLGI